MVSVIFVSSPSGRLSGGKDPQTSFERASKLGEDPRGVHPTPSWQLELYRTAMRTGRLGVAKEERAVQPRGGRVRATG
jgi:hypothetical protein